MDTKKWKAWILVWVMPMIFVAGCRSVQTLPVAQRTPTQCGNIKLYGTDNVPFEYQELGVIGVTVTHQSLNDCLEAFAGEARKMDADAVLNFRVVPVQGTGGFMYVTTISQDNRVCMTGVAVKIKRP